MDPKATRHEVSKGSIGSDALPLPPTYDVDVVLVPEAHRLEVRGRVTLPPSDTGYERLGFLLRADVRQLRIEVLEPASCRGLVEVQALERVMNMAATQNFHGRLPSQCPPGRPLVMTFEYECGSEENRRWLSLSQEFCFSSFYASAWLPTFGYRRGTGKFRYSVPKEMVVAATGDLQGKQAEDERTVYTFVTEVPSVFDFVAGPFSIQRLGGRVPVSVYHLQPLPRAREIMRRTADIIAALEDEFGPYPFGELAIVEAPMGPALYAGLEGGAYPGYFLVRSDLLHSGLEDWVAGHELTHFWFPHVVGHREESGAPAMLDEALAHYGALRVIEALGGPAAAEQFRRDGAQAAIQLTAAGFEHRLGADSTSERWNRIAYNYSNTKGHLVYDMLARAIGRERFRAALQRIVREHAGRELGWGEFLRSVEVDAGQRLEWFYEQWFDRPELPVLSFEWDQSDGSLRCSVTQLSPAFRLDIPLQIEFSDGSTLMQSVLIEDLAAQVKIPVDRVVYAVRLDPHYTILHATPDQWAEAEARRFLTHGKMLWDEEEFDEALALFQHGLELIPDVDPHGVEFLLRLHIGWLHQEAGRLQEALAQYEKALDQAVRPPEFLARLYLNLATVAKEVGNHDRAVWAARNVLSSERSLDKETDNTRRAREILSTEETQPA